MERGSYVSASGGLVQLRKLDVVSNNLANANTPGFKRQVLVGEEQSFDQTLANMVGVQDPYARGDHERTPGVVDIQTVTDFSAGPIQFTGNPLDVALRKENQFFVIEGPAGPLYTRAGNFTLDGEGNLVTQDGFTVLGDGGQITAAGTGVKIGPDGRVFTDEGTVGRLQVVEMAEPRAFERVGGTRFAMMPAERIRAAGLNAAEPEQIDNPDIVSASLEMPNVSAMTSIIDLISVNRAFELYTKTAQTIDQMNQTSIQRIGSRR
jgi:flagellar basal body rod protein FlgG